MLIASVSRARSSPGPTLCIDSGQEEFAGICKDFFDHHSAWALVGLTIFPRITLFVAFAFGGFWWWLGWLIAPHFLVAILALPYWDTNPVLVILAWLFALAGTGGEASVANRRAGL
jgi:hypothetical protein